MTEAEKTKQIIADNLYMTIASVDERGDPWITPVYMCYDNDFNLYWVSEIDTRHSQNIEKNKRVAISIFDSTAPAGHGRGVYITAHAERVEDEGEMEKIVPLYYDRMNKSHKSVQDFSGASSRRFYRAEPVQVWINEDGVDKRIGVTL